MLVEMPRRVWPLPGVQTVPFPWALARSVLIALTDARTTLSLTLDTHTWNALLITGWQGAYRDEFDEAYARLCAAARDLLDRAVSRADAVVEAAADASWEQHRQNARTAGLVGAGVPISIGTG
jgi:hypothetical protein